MAENRTDTVIFRALQIALNVYFSLPHARSVPVKVGLAQAGSGSGLETLAEQNKFATT